MRGTWVRWAPLGLALGALALVSACGGADRGEEAAGSGAAVESKDAPHEEKEAHGGGIEAARAEAKQIFATRCATCHGPEGEGDGPGSAGLTPKPRNLQDHDWQASVSDEHIEQIVRYGGAAVGRSPAMPSNPDLLAKDEVVAALREHVRSLSR